MVSISQCNTYLSTTTSKQSLVSFNLGSCWRKVQDFPFRKLPQERLYSGRSTYGTVSHSKGAPPSHAPQQETFDALLTGMNRVSLP